ncbi:MAG: hypothetical protein ACI4OE_07005 [Alphaproteobacteria bacterium]
MDALFSEFQNLLANANSTSNLFVKFYDRAVKTGELGENNLPKFENKTFVEIRMRDNNTEVIDQPATADKIARFPVEYARYQLNKKQKEEGTPLEQFAFLTGDQIEALQYRGIFTIEKLCNLNKEQIAQLGVESEKTAAEKFLELNKNNGKLVEFEKKEAAYCEEIAKLKDEVERLTAQNAELTETLEKAKAELAEKKNK